MNNPESRRASSSDAMFVILGQFALVAALVAWIACAMSFVATLALIAHSVNPQNFILQEIMPVNLSPNADKSAALCVVTFGVLGYLFGRVGRRCLKPLPPADAAPALPADSDSSPDTIDVVLGDFVERSEAFEHFLMRYLADSRGNVDSEYYKACERSFMSKWPDKNEAIAEALGTIAVMKNTGDLSKDPAASVILVALGWTWSEELNLWLTPLRSSERRTHTTDLPPTSIDL